MNGFAKRLRQRVLFALFYLKPRVAIRYQNIPMEFNTSSRLAKNWFYPRYGFGAPHEPALCDQLREHLNRDSVFFDVGANLGFFTVLAALLCPQGQVHAFEMDPRLLSELQKNLEINRISAKVLVNACAVFSKTGELVRFRPHQKGNPSTNQLFSPHCPDDLVI